ncbi:MAG: carboxypeptidase regulatory-like domain-containing protein, partial [Bacteroidaceae bacterium]|nr:carboxypeptidase regulatory-like domain-containing protein [Bacteroidaceae bacterium]
VDAILAADISITRSVGTTNGFYCGTFYGNGHTLTVNITGEEYAAPFGIIKNATIRDLNVKGTVTGGRHSSGLVGNCVSTGTENHIENCHVSTNVITSDRYAGGIIGHGHSVKNNIINCLFDGSITATEFNTTSYAGAFMGWEDGGTSNNVKNNLESANYYNFNHTGLNYNANNGGSAWGGSNNYHFRNWGEGNNASNLTIDDLVSKLGSANWLVSGNIALPKQSVTQVGQGFSASDLSVAALDSILGNGWQQMGNLVTPVMQTSTEPEHQSIIWDERANVSLNIDKKVENEVRYKEQHTITQEELLNRQVQLDLCTSCVDHDFRLKVEKGESKLPLFSTDTLGFTVKKKEVGELARYEFNNNVQLGTVKADTLQQGVLLKWGISSGVADYYRILRADKMKPEVVDTLVMNYVQTTYLDQTAKVQRNYIYTIEGVTQCEGDHVSTVTVEGCRVPTGTVRGYVRLSNGTGLPNVEVTATPKGNILNAITKTVKTDESGFFEISGLIYQTKGVYDISADGIKGSHDVTFDDDYNLFTDITFYEETYYTFSGYVLYEGSSIPVGGVTFLRDGQPVINSAGQEVTTTPQGAFEISVPGGSHTIQVVKEGHVFENDGFYIDLDKEEGDNRKHNWQKDINNIYLWDKTKVYLQGRVVGGNDQGYLPLGESLSKNNLGEDITIIMELEGDNTSWLVRDQLDPTITTRTNKYCHGLDSKDTTEVIASRRQLKIHPDKNTGEYRIPLYPVKYKVTEIYAKGYSTLFQTGMVSETVNLSDLTNGQTGTYSRIYHTAPTLNVKQRQDEINDTYFGISKYTSRDIAGNNVEIKLWQNGKYTLGYPVFMSGIDVPLWIEACEEYYWNNSPLAEKKDIVRLHGGKVIAKNGLVSTETTDEIELNEAGGASYIFKPRNTTFTLENDMALRKLNFTLEYDSCFYDMQPLEGYIMAATEVPQGRRIVAGENAHLVDILRDPPGSGSSAYIEEGTKLSYSYTADIKAVVGVSLDLGLGKGNDYFMGIWFGEGHGDVAGSINSTTNYGSVTLNAVVGYYNDWTYNYEITTNERIETSSETNGKASNIGANADLYIGFADNIIVADGIAVYPVNSKTLSYLTPREGNTVKVNGYDFDVKGTVKILARGYDEGEGDSIYLIRNEVMKVSSSPKASFIYSQQHILNDIIPTLLRSRAALLKPTMDAAEAQKLANDTKETVYVSNVEIDDPKFGYDYHVYYPAGGKDTNTNEVQKLNNRIAQWAGFIAANEKEKMEAKTLMKRYDFDGMASISYSESMSADRTEHRYIQIPGITLSGDGATPASGQKDAQPHYTDSGGDDPQMNGVEFIAGGLFVQLKIMPVAQFDFNYNNGQEENRTKGTGFTLKCSPRSNLSVAVYYTENLSEDSIAALDKLGSIGKYYKFTKETMENIYSPTLGPDNQLSWLTNDKRTRYRNFVFRTEGGATESPWEDERRTIFHNAGKSILDQKTMQIDKLRIWADKQSVSNVPMGEPARFTIYMANEGEMPASVTKALKIFADDAMNPKGAHIVVNGVPITGSGFDIWLEPNTIMEKVVEIYANEEYDYEDIGLCIINENDIEHVETVTLSAHFVPSAGKINISSPGDKWVMNTDSYYDSDKQAYSMPIHIDGFDVNFRNFDHIELQYKLSTQGEKEWVNVCSFYRKNEEGEKLMALASGERKLMEHDGYIDVDFYGEVDPIEQRYDIRAVAYCRHGNGYLTSSSNVLSGIKDTRRPQPFGTPQPANGILGIGDDIKIAFSEPIAGNYLSPINNFQVLGLTNSSNISLSTALHFTGQSMAISQAARNLTAKDFTLDVMIKPEKTGKEMVVLSHGNHEH